MATATLFPSVSEPGYGQLPRDSGPAAGHSSFLSPSDIHVLVVDDERLSRTIVSSLLRKCCYKVTVVDSGVTALETLKTSRPGTFNLVLTDLIMPEVDGLDLLRYVREDENLRSVPVVMMSASERSETIFECIKDGAEDYLLKPLKPKEVEYIWQHVWRRQHSAGTVPRLGDEEDYYEEAAAAGHFSVGSVPLPADQAFLASDSGAPAFRSSSGGSSAAESKAWTRDPAPFSTQLARSQTAAVPSPSHHTQQQLQLNQQLADLSTWLARRQHLDTRDAFDVFCRLVSLLKAYHLQSKPFGRLRPSQLGVTASGAVAELQSPASPPAEEQGRYASPEEEAGAPPSPSSDVYSLGMLFVELFYTVGHDSVSRAAMLRAVRQGSLPAAVSSKPEEAAFLNAALASDPAARLKLIDLIYSDTLPRLLASLSTPARGGQAGPRIAAEPASRRGKVQLRQPRTLSMFLDILRTTTITESSSVCAELALLDADITHAQRALASRRSRQQRAANPGLAIRSSDAAAAGSKRDCRSVALLAAAKRPRCGGPSAAPSAHEPSAVADAKFGRLTSVLGQLEGVYRQRRTQAGSPQEGLAGFCRDLASYSRYSSLAERATVRYVDLHSLNDLVCSIAFDRDDEYFATAGVSRRLKVFDFQSVLENDAPIHYPVLEINARSKLSCVVWNPYIKSNILCSDYDGTIQLWDACTKQELMQFDEHAHRVWSVDFAASDPTRFLSGSDDHTVKLWALNCENSVATMDAKANVCSVQFHPHDSNIVACGAANYRVYVHDLRNTSAPLAVLSGHNKAVSYVRFLDGGRLVSAATDHQLRLWDLAGACNAGRSSSPLLTYRGHANEKNFVGMSVSRDGYIACGSEDNAAYVYAASTPMPVTRYEFSAKDQGVASGGHEGGGASDGLYQHFVSSVAWSRRSRYLTAANSMGVLKVLETQ